ncbi:MAG: response regulator [Magnetococcales bacterium]|nr:response regulator [Magnetococcales bacterium]NGZ27076.1 response regulator [Magnetococcales bacterium]
MSVVLIGIVLSFYLFLMVKDLFQEQLFSQFKRYSEDRFEVLEHGFEKLLLPEQNLAAMLQTMPVLPSQDDLRAIILSLKKNQPSLHALDWIPPHPDAKLLGRLFDTHTPVELKELSESLAQSTVKKQATLSDLVMHENQSNPIPMVWALHPVVRQDEKEKKVVGTVVAGLNMARFAETMISSLQPGGIDFLIHDVSHPGSPKEIYFHPSRMGGTPKERRQAHERAITEGVPNQQREIQLLDKRWRLEAVLTPIFPHPSGMLFIPWLVLLSGLTITGLLGMHLHTTQKERNRLFNLLELIPAFVHLQAPDYTIRFANRRFTALFGEHKGRPCYEVIWGRQSPCTNCQTFQVFSTQKHQEWEWTDMDGRTFLIHDHPFHDSNGDLLVLEMGVDITDRKQAEISLLQAHQKLEDKVQERTAALSLANRQLMATNAVLSTQQATSPDGIYLADKQGHMISWNNQFIKMWCVPNEVMETGNPDHAIQVALSLVVDGDGFTQRILELYANLEESEENAEVALRDGRVFVRHSRGVQDEEGTYWGRIWFYRDITHRKIMENELRLAKKASDANAEAKSAFLATMSHEIRTPLNTILGMSELLRETHLNLEQSSFLNTTYRSGQALLAIINDILDLSKIEAGQMNLESHTFTLHELVEETLDILKLQAQEKGLQLLQQLSPDLPNLVVGDRARLRQVLLNLTSNAIKFTEQGHVLVTVENGEEDFLRFQVIDTGIGIPQDKLGAIFLPFHQADASVTRRYGGTGLGLTICQKLITRMGGKIQVESSPGHGSCFTFTARLPRSNEKTLVKNVALEGQQGEERPLHVLLVDDSEDNRIMLHHFLKSTPHRLTSAVDGLQGLELFTEHPFDLVFMDIQMPMMDGYEATRRMRALERERNRFRTPIIALSAHAMRETQELMEKAGCDLSLTKPIRKADFLRIVSQNARTPRHSESAK